MGYEEDGAQLDYAESVLRLEGEEKPSTSDSVNNVLAFSQQNQPMIVAQNAVARWRAVCRAHGSEQRVFHEQATRSTRGQANVTAMDIMAQIGRER